MSEKASGFLKSPVAVDAAGRMGGLEGEVFEAEEVGGFHGQLVSAMPEKIYRRLAPSGPATGILRVWGVEERVMGMVG